MKYLILVLLCSIGLQAQTYKGTIGKYQIFFELDYHDNQVTASYFYKSHLKNIPLEGYSDGENLILYEKFSDIKEQKERFTISVIGDKITGTWQNNGQSLNVDLLKTETQLEDYKLSRLEYIKDSVTVHDKKTLAWFTEKHSKHSFFRVAKGFKKSECEFMNDKLEKIHADYALTQLNCNGMELRIELELLTNQYLSFTEYSSVYCGGAHPSHNTVGYNFDYRNKIQLDKITTIYPNLNLYQVLIKKYGNDTDSEPECEYFSEDESKWDYATWVLTKEGITITPSYPYALTPCKTDFPLTYKELEHFK